MAQLVKCLSCKHEDPSSSPQNAHKELGMVIRACILDHGRCREVSSLGLTGIYPSCIGKFQASKKPGSKNKVGKS